MAETSQSSGVAGRRGVPCSSTAESGVTKSEFNGGWTLSLLKWGPKCRAAACHRGDAEEEQATFVEHGSSAPRAWAEALARLDPAQPPVDVLPNRWIQFH